MTPTPSPGADPAPRILFVERGEFCGINRSVREALHRAGCTVLSVDLSLRSLPWRPLLLVAMLCSAVRLYGRDFRRFLHRTPIASRALSRAMQRAIAEQGEVDAAIFSGGAACRLPADRDRSVPFALLTDHFNFMSKRLPDLGAEIPEKRVHGTWESIERVVAESFDHVFVLGQDVRNAVIDEWALPPSRISSIGAGSSHDLDIERDRKRKSYADRRILLLANSRFNNGLDDVLRAFASARMTFPDSTLHVVGGGAVVEQEGVLCHGTLEREEVRQLFYDSQILVLPSHREPFGLSLLEGMWSKCACIGSRTGATPDIISDGRTGYLFTPGDSDALSARIKALLAEPGRLKLMAEAGYAEAKQRWHWDHAAQQILAGLLRRNTDDTWSDNAVA